MQLQLRIIFLVINSINGYNILGIFPVSIPSHFNFAKALLIGLSKNGHNLTVISYFPNDENITNYSDIIIPGAINKEKINLNVLDQNHNEQWHEFHHIQQWGLNDCETILKSGIINNILKSSIKFDVIITEQFNNDCILFLNHILKIPLISLSSCFLMPWLYERFGTPLFSSTMPPNNYRTALNMNFFDRMHSLIYFHYSSFWYKQITRRQTNELIKKYINDSMPDINEIAMQYSGIMILNQHFSFTGSRAYTPNIIEASGLQIPESKPLDKEMKSILDKSINGVIYINWGSMIRSDTLPTIKREAIIKAITKLDYDVIWKWENESMPNKPKNVYLRKWMPQFDILCHPNVKVFMTHGGLMGASESAYCAVPVIITPIFGDQFVNAEIITNQGLGAILPYDDITAENVYEKLIGALDKKSKMKAKKISFNYKNRPEHPLKTAIWWVENVAGTKGNVNIKTQQNNMDWIVLASIDIYATIVLIILLIIFIIFTLIKKIYKFILSQLQSNEKKIKKTK